MYKLLNILYPINFDLLIAFQNTLNLIEYNNDSDISD